MTTSVTTSVTTQAIIARNAGAVYDFLSGNASMASFVTQVGSKSPSVLLNLVFNSVFSANRPTATLEASVLAANLGITPLSTTASGVTTALTYLVNTLTANPFSNWGAVIDGMISLFSGLTSDATFGLAATAWNKKVATAVAYAATPSTVDGQFSPNSNFTIQDSTFTLATGSSPSAVMNVPAVTPGSWTRLNITGGANLIIGQVENSLATIDSTLFDGSLIMGSLSSLTLMNDSLVSIYGGSGNTKLYLSNLGSNSTISLGAGQNQLVLNGIASIGPATISNVQTIELAGTATGILAATGNGGTGYGANNASFDFSKTTGLTTLQLDGASKGNTGIETISLGTAISGLHLNLVGTGTPETQIFNGIAFASGTAFSSLTETISNQGVSVVANAITVGPQTLTGFTAVTINIVDTGSNITNFGTILDDNLVSLTINSNGSVALGKTDIFSTLSKLDLSGVSGLETGSITSEATSFTLLTGPGAGSNAINIIDTSATTFKATSSGALALTLGDTSSGDLGAATSLTFINKGSSTFKVADNIGTVLSSLTLIGNVTDVVKADATTSGITVAGATDNANVSFTAVTGAIAGATDTFTLGTGIVNIVDPSLTGAIIVELGTATTNLSTINLYNAGVYATTYSAAITLGRAHSGGDIISVGTLAASAVAPNTVINNLTAGDIISIKDAKSFVALTTANLDAVQAAANFQAAVALVDGNTMTSQGLGLPAHAETMFTYDSNTYLLETVAGGNKDNGVMPAGNTLIELTGLHATHAYTFAQGSLTLTS